MVLTTHPTLTEREQGGWMALSPDDAPLRIAVLGDSPEQAKANYGAATEAWERLLAAAEARREAA